MREFIISLGGSMVNPEHIDFEFINRFVGIMRQVQKDRYGVVVGGGITARNYVNAMKKYTSNDFFMDEIGIRATRMNAMLLASAMGNKQEWIPESVVEGLTELNRRGTVVMGGTVPGHTTDTVSMLLAESAGIKDVINITSVDAVYSEDPRKNPNAIRFDRLDYDEAFRISLASYTGAGSNQFMDSVSLLIGKRAGINLHIISGKDFDNMEKCISGKKYVGTLVTGD
ncbi:MAG: UMP kinase [Candidatus Thermoplasmatota archaeon]|jgi:uridylate kinase|nr:UMP kinase [Candidatus Thermoplasmatota archaeon]MCL5791221.1 UMP kinase [Candidatus Thermoplasmatota archaeon]